MSAGKIPSAKADLAVLSADYEARRLDRCGHGKTWDADCPECCAVWREDACRDLVRLAAKYGFKLVPLDA